MAHSITTSKAYPFLEGGGEMGHLTRSYDWSQTPIGEPDSWPYSLRSTVGIVLHSSFPMLLFWGRDTMITFYNDAFLPSLGTNGKHPALGKPAWDMWSDIWQYIGPLLNKVIDTGEAVYFEDHLVPFYRNGRVEDIYWTFCYSPAFDDDGAINGALVTCTETTQKVVRTRQLMESKNHLEFAIEAAELGTWDLDAATGKLFVNKRLKDWFGFRDGQVVTLADALQMVDEQDRERVAAAINNAMDYHSGGSYTDIYTIVHPISGYRRIVRAKGRVRFNEAHEAVQLNGTLQDITEQVTNILSLEKSEAQLELLSNAVPAMIFYLDKDQRYTTYNETFMKWFGVNEYEVIGKTVREFIGEEAYQIVAPHLAIGLTGEREQYEMIAPSRVNGPRWLSIDYTPHIRDGEVVGLIVHATDITQSKQTELALRDSEARFRSLIEEAPVPTCLYVGRDLVIDIANDAMIRIWGKTRAVIGQRLKDAVPELEGQRFLGILDNIFTTGETHSETNAPANLVVDGKLDTYYFNYTYKPLFNRQGVVYAIMNMAIDVTAQVRATHQIEEVVAQRTAELAEANRMLQQSNSELEQFAYVASHDLQEPLRKVMIFTAFLQSRMQQADESTNSYLSKIHSSTLRMVELIRDVLNFSRLSRKSEVREEVSLQTLIDQLVVDFEIMIREKGAIIHYHDLPALYAHPLQMRQLFSNLLSNALKFHRLNEAPRVTIAAQMLTPAEKRNHPELLEDLNYCSVSVADNGIGLNEEYAEKIFGIFQRLHSKTEYEGTGIGLALCKKITQNHHGKIWVNSGREGGAVFHVILPCK